MQFEITKDLVQCFTAEYYQFQGENNLMSFDCTKTISQIYTAMCELEAENKTVLKTLEQRYFNEIFNKQFPEEVYNKLIKTKECHYCGITLDDINQLAEKGKLFKKNERGWCMEIDRKKPNQEYSDENCVAACYWCNNAKTDEFDDVEFKPVGELIGKTLRNRL